MIWYTYQHFQYVNVVEKKRLVSAKSWESRKSENVSFSKTPWQIILEIKFWWESHVLRFLKFSEFGNFEITEISTKWKCVIFENPLRNHIGNQVLAKKSSFEIFEILGIWKLFRKIFSPQKNILKIRPDRSFIYI